MTQDTIADLETFMAPYGRTVKLQQVTFGSGMCLLRMTIVEGRRFTILDIDAATARHWSSAMTSWADRVDD